VENPKAKKLRGFSIPETGDFLQFFHAESGVIMNGGGSKARAAFVTLFLTKTHPTVPNHASKFSIRRRIQHLIAHG
jgi:hypothetical protein